MHKNRHILYSNSQTNLRVSLFSLSRSLVVSLRPMTERNWLTIEVYRSTERLHAFSFLSPKIQQTYLGKPYILSDKCTLLSSRVSFALWMYACVNTEQWTNMHVLVIYLVCTFWSTVASINSNWSAYSVWNTQIHKHIHAHNWMTPKCVPTPDQQRRKWENVNGVGCFWPTIQLHDIWKLVRS